MKNIIKILVLSSLLTGCDDLFEPAIENNLGFEYMYENAGYFQMGRWVTSAPFFQRREKGILDNLQTIEEKLKVKTKKYC